MISVLASDKKNKDYKNVKLCVQFKVNWRHMVACLWWVSLLMLDTSDNKHQLPYDVSSSVSSGYGEANMDVDWK